MKQNITKDQFWQAPEKVREKLIELINVDAVYYFPNRYITIGKMIEIINDKDLIIHGNQICFATCGGGYTPENQTNDLCDNLWEATIEALKD